MVHCVAEAQILRLLLSWILYLPMTSQTVGVLAQFPVVNKWGLNETV